MRKSKQKFNQKEEVEKEETTIFEQVPFNEMKFQNTGINHRNCSIILTHWIITKKAVKWIREVYLYEKYHDLKISDDGNWVMVVSYNSFEIFDWELNQKG